MKKADGVSKRVMRAGYTPTVQCYIEAQQAKAQPLQGASSRQMVSASG
jgi:hypothetical protein